MSDLFQSLRALNAAAYSAVRAGRDTTAHPDLDRHTLRRICALTDKLVDDNAPGITLTPRAADRGASLTGGQASARATSPAGPFSSPDAAPTHGHAAVTGGCNPPRTAAGDIEDDGLVTVYMYPAPFDPPRNHAEEIANAIAQERAIRAPGQESE